MENPVELALETVSALLRSESIFLKTTIEFLSPFHPCFANLHFVTYYKLLIFLGISSFILNYKRLDLTNLSFFILFSYISIRMVRGVPLFAIVTYILIIINLKGFFEAKGIEVGPYWSIPLILVILVFIYGIFKDHSRWIPAEVGFGISKRFPIKAVDFINRIGLSGRIFTHYDHGGYIIYRCAPRLKVFMDGRTEFYNEEIFRDYLNILHKGPEFEGLIERYGIDFFLVPHNPSLGAWGILNYLSKSEKWRLIYFDDNILLYVKAKEEYEPVIKEHAYRFIDPIIRSPFRNEDAKWVIQEIERAIEVNPQSWFVYMVGGQVYRELGRYEEASGYIKKAKELNPNIDIQ
jgi:hypothetical protein